jgi:2-oxoglutarate ferredoxin oxidoreductase subunit delta
MKKNEKLIIHKERCKSCQICVLYCPKKALSIGEKLNKIGYRYVILSKEDACTACGICAEMCPEVVIEVWRENE